MATIKSSKIGSATDGRKLVRVVFTPQVPNPAAQSDVEVIWEIQKSEAVHLCGDLYAILGPLSCTLVDTREPYTLSSDQRQALIAAVLSTASETDEDDW